MRKVVLILLALLAVRLLPRALRREAAALHLIAALTRLATTMAVANTSKTVATEQRVATVETRMGTAEDNITTAQSTANNALPKGGGTVTGDLHVNGRLYLSSGSMPQSLGGGAVSNNDGFGGGVWTASQASHLSAWQNNYNETVNFCNNMRDTLNNAGVI